MGKKSRQLSALRPVTFRYKEDSQGQPQYGLIAEEVARVYPELGDPWGHGRSRRAVPSARSRADGCSTANASRSVQAGLQMVAQLPKRVAEFLQVQNRSAARAAFWTSGDSNRLHAHERPWLELR